MISLKDDAPAEESAAEEFPASKLLSLTLDRISRDLNEQMSEAIQLEVEERGYDPETIRFDAQRRMWIKPPEAG